MSRFHTDKTIERLVIVAICVVLLSLLYNAYNFAHTSRVTQNGQTFIGHAAYDKHGNVTVFSSDGITMLYPWNGPISIEREKNKSERR